MREAGDDLGLANLLLAGFLEAQHHEAYEVLAEAQRRDEQPAVV